jgi:hypothetical protein
MGLVRAWPIHSAIHGPSRSLAELGRHFRALCNITKREKRKEEKKKVVAGGEEEVGAMEKGANTRRRRLVERGTDRLAFITGQTRSLSADAQSGDAFCFS